MLPLPEGPAAFFAAAAQRDARIVATRVSVTSPANGLTLLRDPETPVPLATFTW